MVLADTDLYEGFLIFTAFGAIKSARFGEFLGASSLFG
jgi:hypothetical protein